MGEVRHRSRETSGHGQANTARGQSVVEFALILPVLLLLLLAAIDLGRVYQGWVVLNNAARVGANYAASHADASFDLSSYQQLVSDARDEAIGTLADCGSVPDPAYPSGSDLGDFAEVVLDCEFRPLTPLIGDVFKSSGNAFRVSARSVFPVRTGLLAPAAPPPPNSECLSAYTWDPDNVVAGVPVTFTDATPPTASGWTWRFGDGTGNANSPNPTHTFSTAGTFTVVLNSNSNNIECTPFERTFVVQAPPPPPPPPPPTGCVSSFTRNPVSPVAGTQVAFTDGTKAPASDWLWTFGDGTADATTQNPTHTFSTPGDYIVTLSSRSDFVACTPFEATVTVTELVPTTCKVPSFIGTLYSPANHPEQLLWSSNGFSTTVELAPGNNKTKSWTIQWQSIVAGQEAACNAPIEISEKIPGGKP